MHLSSVNLRLSAITALFERIKPSLRRAYIAEIEDTITLIFYYDGEITEEDEEMAGDAGAEVISDFPGPYMIDWKLIRCDSPEKIPSTPGYLVYARYEKKT